MSSTTRALQIDQVVVMIWVSQRSFARAIMLKESALTALSVCSYDEQAISLEALSYTTRPCTGTNNHVIDML